MKINIPENINEITLSQWQRISLLEKENDYTQAKVLEIIFHVTKKQFNQMKAKDVQFLSGEVGRLFATKSTLQRTFKMKGIEYGLIPNLDDISFAELTDIDTNVEVENYHKLMSILYRPITKKTMGTYEIESYEGTNDSMKDMPLGVALGGFAFFLTLGQELVKATLNSSGMEVPAALQTSGVGFQQFTS